MSWSKKYKKSINCSNPKGFSQKAHCAGRKARQSGKTTQSKSVSEMKKYQLKEVIRGIVRENFKKSLNEGRIPKLFLKIEAVKKLIDQLTAERKAKFGGDYAKKVNLEPDPKKREKLMQPARDITKKILAAQKNLVQLLDMEDKYISQMGMDQELDSSVFENNSKKNEGAHSFAAMSATRRALKRKKK